MFVSSLYLFHICLLLPGNILYGKFEALFDGVQQLNILCFCNYFFSPLLYVLFYFPVLTPVLESYNCSPVLRAPKQWNMTCRLFFSTSVLGVILCSLSDSLINIWFSDHETESKHGSKCHQTQSAFNRDVNRLTLLRCAAGVGGLFWTPSCPIWGRAQKFNSPLLCFTTTKSTANRNGLWSKYTPAFCPPPFFHSSSTPASLLFVLNRTARSRAPDFSISKRQTSDTVGLWGDFMLEATRLPPSILLLLFSRLDRTESP